MLRKYSEADSGLVKIVVMTNHALGIWQQKSNFSLKIKLCFFSNCWNFKLLLTASVEQENRPLHKTNFSAEVWKFSVEV